MTAKLCIIISGQWRPQPNVHAQSISSWTVEWVLREALLAGCAGITSYVLVIFAPKHDDCWNFMNCFGKIGLDTVACSACARECHFIRIYKFVLCIAAKSYKYYVVQHTVILYTHTFIMHVQYFIGFSNTVHGCLLLPITNVSATMTRLVLELGQCYSFKLTCCNV